ncbi:MAG: hypothetical protein KatS3mg110_0929 [Pirellulaceae bacterium]|nr:MAG: hypothetical protein KatS3mg110_0929 [Pirellulaceae bacterium]
MARLMNPMRLAGIATAGLAVGLLITAVIWIGRPTVPADQYPASSSPPVEADASTGPDSPQAFTRLVPNQSAEARVGTAADSVQHFRVDVPDDAVMMELRLVEAPINLDLFCMRQVTWKAQEAPEFSAATELFNEVLRITPWDPLPLEPGEYIVEVRPAPGETPRIDYRPVFDDVAFKLEYRLVRVGQPAAWPLDNEVTLEVGHESGYAAIGAIDIPAGTSCLRLDLFNTSSSLDLLLGREGPIVHGDNALLVHDGAESRKWIMLTTDTQPALEPGRYFVAVVDRFQSPAAVSATLRISRSADVPAPLLAIPELPQSQDPWQRAVAATVELIVEGNPGGGTGAIVSPDGLIVTNYHVVIDQREQPARENGVLVAMTLSPETPPVDLFRASPVYLDADRDLALLRISQGFYHQPLPDGQRFPWIPVRWNATPQLGDSLTVIGYPWIGGVSGRVTVTLTRGVLAGFERRGEALLWKTDADFHPGNSGGPVLDEKARLLGLASETVEEEAAAGKIGWIRPINQFPEPWKKLIEESQ